VSQASTATEHAVSIGAQAGIVQSRAAADS
jgi:hypothetical protein